MTRFEIEVLSLNPLRGRVVTMVVLDREEIETYQLQLVAMDNASVPLTTAVPVTVTMVDTNDNAPVFNMSVYTLSIPEDTAYNTIIAEITVSLN